MTQLRDDFLREAGGAYVLTAPAPNVVQGVFDPRKAEQYRGFRRTHWPAAKFYISCRGAVCSPWSRWGAGPVRSRWWVSPEICRHHRSRFGSRLRIRSDCHEGIRPVLAGGAQSLAEIDEFW